MLSKTNEISSRKRFRSLVIKSENKLWEKKFACSPIRIENTPDVLCMAGNKNKFLFAECVAECFWTSSNFKNDPQIRLSSGSFKTKTEPKTCLRNLDPSALDAFHHFIRYSSPSLASGEDRYTASPMTNRTGLKSTSVWLIDQFCRVNLFSFFWNWWFRTIETENALLFLLDE